MFKTILWATDGSETADRALPYARALAEGGGKLIAVALPGDHRRWRAGGYPVLTDEDELEAKVHRQVEELRAAAIDASEQVITAAGAGSAHVIADAARETGADLIVVGTRGHAPVAGLLVGSVTQRLLHVAPCPVLVVPGGKHAELGERELESAAAAR